jgi:hypothetical protein
MTVMRKIAVAAILLAGLVLPAHAQQGKYDAEDAAKKRDADILDKQYKTILELTDKTAPTKADPWQNMRGAQQAETPKRKN